MYALFQETQRTDGDEHQVDGLITDVSQPHEGTASVWIRSCDQQTTTAAIYAAASTGRTIFLHLCIRLKVFMHLWQFSLSAVLVISGLHVLLIHKSAFN